MSQFLLLISRVDEKLCSSAAVLINMPIKTLGLALGVAKMNLIMQFDRFPLAVKIFSLSGVLAPFQVVN